MGDPDQAPLLADRRDRLRGRQSGRDRRFEEGRDEVTVRTADLLADVSPSGAASRARRAPSTRSWSVTIRWVRPRDAAADATSSGRDRLSNDAPV
jgi:hypothetical protein